MTLAFTLSEMGHSREQTGSDLKFYGHHSDCPVENRLWGKGQNSN